jgi:hypothetical protein
MSKLAAKSLVRIQWHELSLTMSVYNANGLHFRSSIAFDVLERHVDVLMPVASVVNPAVYGSAQLHVPYSYSKQHHDISQEL